MSDPVTAPIAKFLMQFYIDGEWCAPESPRQHDIVNPATEAVLATVALGNNHDVDKAVLAARAAFPGFSQTSVDQRIELLKSIADVYGSRATEMAALITAELGAPTDMANALQAGVVQVHIHDFIEALKSHVFMQQPSPGYEVHKEAIGVCGLITPWNWPMSQIALKVFAALAAGCTMVLKPSEVTPLNAILFAEIMHKAGVPKGVFNLVNGDGPTVGSAMSRHPDVDLLSFTGSTKAGIAVSQDASTTVKRVALELGGKSPNIIFADADVESAVTDSLLDCFLNSGQSCDAPTRMLVEKSVYDEAVKTAARVAEGQTVDLPSRPGDHIGPLVSATQFGHVQGLIRAGIEEGARVVAGGLGRPQGLDVGYYVKPTVFAYVRNDMKIAQEEIFGPVVVMIPFEDEDEAIRIANDTPYGLAAYIQSGDIEKARRVGRQLRAGTLRINGAPIPDGAPFGGYKHSGTGREGGSYGIDEFLEIKTLAVAAG